MTPIATVIIPYSEPHEQLRFNAIQSAYAQTVKVDVICELSPNTPAIVRNRGLHVNTDFLVFLDADDLLLPSFVEDCLRAYETGKYVYTSWYCWNTIQKPNLCVTVEKDYKSHLVTTLYPTAAFKALGGFDVTLAGHEDVDFYLRSHALGVCGTYLDKPLIDYSQYGTRSNAFNELPNKKDIMDLVYLKNGGQQTTMACCGQPSVPGKVVIGEAQAGDIMVMSLWAGMRSEYSATTNRLYVGGNGSELPINPLDVGMTDRTGAPLFRVVEDLTQLAPTREIALKQAGLI